ncbi:MAG: hypothetical protein ABR962_09910 [Candidatus Bathyarchaeia archaeon]|jgi:hypothetical protein
MKATPSIMLERLIVFSSTINQEIEMIYMTCQNGQCKNETNIRRQTTQPRSPEEIRYGTLWAEIELQKLVRGDKQ